MLSMIQQMENFYGGNNSGLFYVIVYKKFLNMLLSIRGFDAMIFEKSIFLFIWQSIDDISFNISGLFFWHQFLESYAFEIHKQFYKAGDFGKDLMFKIMIMILRSWGL